MRVFVRESLQRKCPVHGGCFWQFLTVRNRERLDLLFFLFIDFVYNTYLHVYVLCTQRYYDLDLESKPSMTLWFCGRIRVFYCKIIKFVVHLDFNANCSQKYLYYSCRKRRQHGLHSLVDNQTPKVKRIKLIKINRGIKK